MSIATVDPTTGETVATFDPLSEAELDAAIGRAHAAQRGWARRSLGERTRLLGRAGEVLRARKDELAALMALEMGKPLAEGFSEVEKCAWVCEHYAEHAARFLAPRAVGSDASRSEVVVRPLGVVLAIMPWNFPFWQVFRFAAPALALGNAGLLKHAESVPQCARAIAEVFAEAGAPEGVFVNLPLEVEAVAGVIADPRVRGVTLTGSTPAGREVAAAAGAALKPTVLELGGSDPYLILEDADLEHAATQCVTSRLINSGQSCIAAKRLVVVEAVRERFEQLVVEGMRAAKVGPPSEEGCSVGPMARADLRDALQDQVERSVAAGARCLLGGERRSGPGFFVSPTVLTDVAPGMPAYDEELFGPVAAIVPVADEAEAIRVANDTPYGLGAAVFTADVERGWRIARDELEAGCCFVNGFVRSDPRLPFGGIKDSGYGRELGAAGLLAFANVKTLWAR